MAMTPATIHHQADGGEDTSVKLAVSFLPESIIIVVGFSEPETVPLQWLNSYPSLAVAVRVTSVPTTYP